jgi:uncharacterized protein YkwD/outer membrane murein-binding lipoprotein Lpp
MYGFLAILALAWPGATTAGAPARDDEVALLVARLRDPRIKIDERDAIRAQLLAAGEEGARALQRHLEERDGRIEERATKREKRHLADVEKAARKLVEGRLDKRALAEVDKLRKDVASLRNDAALTKERIHEVGDPAMARLKELLDVAIEDVLDFDAELSKARQALVEDLFELEEDFGLWQRCNAALPERKRSKELSDPSARWPQIETTENWICLLATPMSNNDRDVLVKNREVARALAEPEEAAGILDLNRLRIRLGLNAVSIDLKLCDAARDHSNDMRTLGFFAHESPVEGKKTPWDRAARMGTSASAENIAGGQTTGVGANQGWWYSPGHHKNMLGGHSRVGLGRSETLWTQMFG